MMATDVDVVIYASSGDYYAKTHEWVKGSEDGPQYQQVVLDEVITANLIGTGNNGKYYSDWRFYTNGSEDGSFSIDAAEGYVLKSATFTYTTTNNGALYFGETKLTTKTAVELSGNKAVFQCKNTNTSSNGQVRLTAIAVTYDVAGEEPPVVPTATWTVAGEPTTIFGSYWKADDSNNDMVKQEDGSYKWEKTELELAAGEIAFKVCKDHSFDVSYPGANYKLAIPESGIYTITITFEPENENKVSAVATKTGEAVVLPTVVLHGDFTGTWKDTDPFAPAEDKLTARLNLTLAEGNYEFGFKFDGAWKANGANITREAPTTSLAEGSGNMHFVADVAGEYELTYTFETQTLDVVYPKKVDPNQMYVWNGNGVTKAEDAIELGGAAEAVQTDGTNIEVGVKQKGNWCLKANKGFNSGAYYLGIAMDNAVNAGDTVKIAYFRTTTKNTYVLGLDFSADKASAATTYQILTEGDPETLEADGIPADVNFLVPEGVANAKYMRIYRNSGGTGLWVSKVEVVKAGDTPTPPEPPTPVTLPVVALAGGMNAWSAEANPLVAAEDSLTASVKVALEEGDVEFKIVSDGKWLSLNGEEPDGLYTFHREWTTASHVNVIDGRNFKLTADVAGDYIFTWTYADSTLAITFPKKPAPVEDGIWKATEETAVTAEAVYVDNDLLKLNTVFAGTLKPNTRTIGGEEFTHAIQVRVDAWPTEDKKTGTEKSGSTPLVLTAKEDIDIILFYNRQVVGEGGTENDNKDVWVFDQADITTPLTGEFTIDQILEGNQYLNAMKGLSLLKGHTYTIAAKGTTLQLHGIAYASATPGPADPTAAIKGSFNEWAEEIPFILSEDKKKASLSVNDLGAGFYDFKMVINGEWRSNGYEFHRGFPGCAGISENKAEDMRFEADIEGAYTFEWYFENDSLAIIFPEKPVPTEPTAAVAGTMSEWEEIPFQLSEDKKKATLYNDNIKEGTYAFKMIINGEWRSNGYEFHRGFPGCAGITGNELQSMTVVIDVEGAYTFEWYFENDSLAIIFPEKPAPVLTDGYYLMGSFNEWKIVADNLFQNNIDAEGEYVLDINLNPGDEIKVAYVEADEAKFWFPKGDNYIVDKNHSGATIMYFRPEYNEAWSAFGGYFYIVPTSTEGIEETLSEGKAVKVLREGNILILKGEHTYTVMGQIVK